jgi:uncharacterized protein
MTFLTAAETGRMGRDVLVPALRAGQVGAGLLGVVDSLGAAYAQHFGFQLAPAYPATSAAPPGYTRTQPDYGRRQRQPGSVWFTLLIIVIFLVLSRGRGGCLPLLFMGGGGRGSGGGWGGGGFGGGGFGGFGGGGGFSGGGSGGSW